MSAATRSRRPQTSARSSSRVCNSAGNGPWRLQTHWPIFSPISAGSRWRAARSEATVGQREDQRCADPLKSIAYGGEAGIRTLGRGLSPYNGLANRRFRPLSHLTARTTSIRCAGTCEITVAPALAPTKRKNRRHRAGKTVDFAKSHDPNEFVARFPGTGFLRTGDNFGDTFGPVFRA
jgi:hypothetical protein